MIRPRAKAVQKQKKRKCVAWKSVLHPFISWSRHTEMNFHFASPSRSTRELQRKHERKVKRLIWSLEGKNDSIPISIYAICCLESYGPSVFSFKMEMNRDRQIESNELPENAAICAIIWLIGRRMMICDIYLFRYESINLLLLPSSFSLSLSALLVVGFSAVLNQRRKNWKKEIKIENKMLNHAIELNFISSFFLLCSAHVFFVPTRIHTLSHNIHHFGATWP